MKNVFLEAALELADSGICVLPLAANEKCPAIPKHAGGRGVKDATKNKDKIRELWEKYKNSNVGIAAGEISGVVGIDIDYKDGCRPDFLKTLPPTVVVETPSGGHHAYFKYPERGIKNGLKLEVGATIRANGFYFVAPPSIHPNGGTYRWLQRGLHDGEIADLPEWILNFQEKVIEEKKPYEIPSEVTEGQRNENFWKLACSLRAKGMEYPEILSGLYALNERTAPPYSDEEIDDIAKRACGYEKGVKKKKERETENSEEYLNCLGHCGDDYFYTSSSNKQIQRITKSAHASWTSFSDLMPYHYWASHFGEEKKNGIVINWNEAAFTMMQRCRDVGIFNPENVRGTGCWEDDGDLVMHLGDRIIVDKKEIPIGKFKSKFIYELGTKIPEIKNNPLTESECRALIDVIENLKWKNPDHGKYFLGWLAICRIAGALNWRPHGWLTGPSGSGKTTVLERVVAPIIGSWGLQFIGSSTEAGIRQVIGVDSRPVVLDEAETTNKKSGNRIQNVLELIRQASSNTNSKIAKGTSNQDGMQFKVNCVFLLSSIRVNLSEEADKNRFCVMELLRNDPQKWPEINEALQKIDNEFGDRLFARMIDCYDSLIKNKDLFANKIAEKYNQRIGQQYGTLLAGYTALFTSGEISESYAGEMVEKLALYTDDELEIEEDEAECLNCLYSYKIKIQDSDNNQQDSSIGLLVGLASQENPDVVGGVVHYSNQLRLWGIKVVPDKQLVFVANHHLELTKIFSGTKWDGIWSRALRRIPGATKYKTRLGDRNSNRIHGTAIPLKQTE